VIDARFETYDVEGACGSRACGGVGLTNVQPRGRRRSTTLWSTRRSGSRTAGTSGRGCAVYIECVYARVLFACPFTARCGLVGGTIGSKAVCLSWPQPPHAITLRGWPRRLPYFAPAVYFTVAHSTPVPAKHLQVASGTPRRLVLVIGMSSRYSTAYAGHLFRQPRAST
jgi:hypothetical protein